MLEAGQFGPAGRTVVIEAFLEGEEISVLALTDSQGVELLPVSQDHKRLLERDRGPNTGGMGAYSPVALATPSLLERIQREVLLPTLEQMRRQATPFSGVLYAGLMIDQSGAPSVVEFNCRLGDPEAQVVLPLVSAGLTDSLWRVAQGKTPSPVETSRRAAVTTVLAARGYPDSPEKGAEIAVPARLPDGVTVFHAGTTRGPDGSLRADGGRVLTVTATGASFTEAQQKSREAAEAIHFDGKIFRRDIGWREAARLMRGTITVTP
jgi:phosphoribosylamine--glycine ligase